MRGSSLTDRAGASALLLAAGLLVLAASSPARGKKAREEARFEGRVTSQTDEPISGVTVRLTGGDPPSVEATTGGDGTFELEVAPPKTGKVTIAFEHPDFARFQNDVELSPGERRNVDVRLVAADVEARQKAIAAYNSAVEALEKDDDREEALRLFAKAAELNPELAEAHLALADLHLAGDRQEEAMDSVRRFRELRPEDEEGRRIEFEIHRRRGDVDAAQRVATEGGHADAAIQSSLAIELYNRGAELLQQRESAAAYAQFEKAHEANPELLPALEALATVAYDLERYDEALKWADLLLAPSKAEAAEEGAEPEPNERGLRTRFLVFDAMNEDEAAAAAFEAYRKVAPVAAADLLYQRADLDFRDGRTEAAKEALERVLEIDPEHPRAHYTMGLVLAGTDPTEARNYFERFLELAPDDPEAAMARDMLEHL